MAITGSNFTGSNQSEKRRFHIAFAVNDIAASVSEYSAKLGAEPVVLDDGQYALWQTAALNFSIRRTGETSGFRHVGWEDNEASGSTESVDSNGVVWERFSERQQMAEIQSLWPTAARS